jgi:hypothetical protein
MILLFRNIDNDIIEVETTLFESTVKQRWYALLQNVLKNDFITYVKTFSLVGNFSKNRTPQMIVKELVEGIEMLKNAEWYPDYDKINEPYQNLLKEFDRDLLNRLHLHFETLQGQIWNPSSFLARATGEERFAISKLNLSCHSLEAYYDSIKRTDMGIGKSVYFYYSICGTPTFEEITLEDKLQFSRTIGNGMIYLHYAQTGKTWYEAYCDQDEHVTDGGISEHRLISGEFSAHIGPQFEFNMDEGFKAFIQSRGFDWEDPNLAIGYCPIGQINKVGDIDITDYEACQKLLEEYDDFYGIKLDDGTDKYYDYRHNSEAYYNKICGVMDTWQNNKGDLGKNGK